MFRLLAPDFTSIHLWLPQQNHRVEVNLQPNKSRCLCLLSNNIKMSTCRLARDRSYLQHPYLCSFGVSTRLRLWQDHPVWEGGGNLCSVKCLLLVPSLFCLLKVSHQAWQCAGNFAHGYVHAFSYPGADLKCQGRCGLTSHCAPQAPTTSQHARSSQKRSG